MERNLLCHLLIYRKTLFQHLYRASFTRFFPELKSGRGMTLTPHPLLVPWSRKGRAIPLLTLWAVRPVQSLSASTGPQCLYRASVPLQGLSACTGPQCLYRASVPIQGLSACTRVHCTVHLLLFCTMKQQMHH